MTSTPIVELRHVTKTINHKNIVDDVSFQIYSGEVFGFLGPNGAGKTTTIRMMTGLIKISRGDILIKGNSITNDFKKAICNVGGIVENPDMYKYLTGYQNLKHYARMVPGVNKAQIREVVRVVGLQDRIQDKVRTYSLGMRQRLGVAQALLHHPSLLILDEPTNGLDPEGIHELRNYLKKIAHEDGVAVLVSSHLLSEMQMMCDRVGVLQHGKLVTVQNIEDFVQNGKVSRVCIMVEPSEMTQAQHIINALNKEIVSIDPSGKILVSMDKDKIPAMNKALMDAGVSVYSIQMQEESLEERFLEITEEKE